MCVCVCRSTLQVELTITPDFQWDEKIHGHSEVLHTYTIYRTSIAHHESYNILCAAYAMGWS